MNNTILGTNTGGDIVNTGGTLTGGYNLIADATNTIAGLTNTVYADPQLGALANNGGPTQTMALLERQPRHRRGQLRLPRRRRGPDRHRDWNVRHIHAHLQWSNDRDRGMAFNAAPSAVQTALNNLSSIGGFGSGSVKGSVTVAGSSSGSTTVYTITFGGALRRYRLAADHRDGGYEHGHGQYRPERAAQCGHRPARSIPFTGTITGSGLTLVTGIASTAGLAPGMPITGSTGIPSGTTIGTVTSTTSITLVYPTGSTPTASGSVSLVATPSRTHGTIVDIGAYEYTDPPTPLDPLATYYTVTDTSNSASDTGSLPYAIAQANANTNTHGSVIEFDPTVFATLQTIGLASTLQLSETAGPEVIVGPSAGVVISGGNTVGVFKVTQTGTNATLMGLTISGGSATYGGGLYNNGTATLYDVIVSGNSATAVGGGIFTRPGSTTTLTQAVVTGNTAAPKRRRHLQRRQHHAQRLQRGQLQFRNRQGFGGGICN